MKPIVTQNLAMAKASPHEGLSDIEEEFVFMKEDIKHVTAVLCDKLGVSLD